MQMQTKTMSDKTLFMTNQIKTQVTDKRSSSVTQPQIELTLEQHQDLSDYIINQKTIDELLIQLEELHQEQTRLNQKLVESLNLINPVTVLVQKHQTRYVVTFPANIEGEIRDEINIQACSNINLDISSK